MEGLVAVLLLLTSTVIIACVVITYAVNVISSIIDSDEYPQLAQLRQLQESSLNQTNSLYSNQTMPTIPPG